MCVVEAGTNRSRGNSEELGDLGRLVANVVAEDQDRPFVWCEPPEASIELVPIGDRKELVLGDRRIDGEHVQVVDPLAVPADVGHADIGEEAVDPGIEPVRIAEARQVTPGDHQRVLQGILGPVDISEDPVRDREQAAATKADQVDERRLVASLCRLDEIAIHALHRVLTPVGGVVRKYWSVDARPALENRAGEPLDDVQRIAILTAVASQ